MSYLLDQIYNYLVASGQVGPTTSWPLHIGFMADDASQMVGLFETGGLPADTLGRENQRPTFQVRVRAARLDYETCRTMWQTLFNLLQDAQQNSSPTLAGIYLIQALHYGPMFFADDQGRSNMTSNWRVLMAADPGTN